MQKNKKERKYHTLKHLKKAYCIIAVVILLVIGASCYFVNSLKKEVHQQRSYSLQQTTEKIVQITDNIINNECERLALISHELSSATQDTITSLLNKLQGYHALKNQNRELKISCIDSKGNTYQWNGKIDRWTIPSMLLDGNPTYQVTILDTVDETTEQMVFLYTLPNPIKLTNEDIEITHTLLYLDMITFGEDLEVSSFDGNSFSYITEQNGTKLYHQQNQKEFISAYNILSALKQTKFLYGESYDNLVASSSSDTTYIAEIEFEEMNYFVSYSKLSINNWNLFIFVPEDYIGGDTTNLLTTTIVQVSIIALLLVFIVSVFVWTNTQQTISKQQLAVDEARKASEAKSNFLSYISHDIRTPLNGIMGMCHIAKQKKDDKAVLSDALEKITLSSKQLMALINDVLDMSRIEQGKLELNNTTLNLKDLIKTCSVYTEVMVKEKGILFKQDTSTISHYIVSTDAVAIEKILTNLLGNAAKFTRPGGRIDLSIKEKPMDSTSSLYQFTVTDNGIGMSEEFTKHLFEPFSQEKANTRTKYQGTGLGLAIVKKLVDALGGTIEVDSILDEGSTFRISLPLAYIEDSIYAENQSDDTFDGTGHRVLLVEDNELNLMIAKSILEECNLEVDTAINGTIALEKFKQSSVNAYSLILMDVRMPVMNGLEATKMIRNLDREDAKTIPIIALSADAFAEDMKKTLQAGMNDHLTKPIDIDKLHSILKKYCKKD